MLNFNHYIENIILWKPKKKISYLTGDWIFFIFDWKSLDSNWRTSVIFCDFVVIMDSEGP